MIIKNIIDEDFINYKETSMFIIFPHCTFKCDKESGLHICQNSSLVHLNNIKIDIQELINRYMNNPITHAVVCGGLEPFDDFFELSNFIYMFRKFSSDTVVIYSGYKKEEILDKVELLKQFPNIIIKFGRFIPNDTSRYDEVLGVTLASHNQYAEKIS